MFSKFAGLVLVLFFVACAKENQSSKSPVRVQMKESGECLSDFGGQLEKYRNGLMAEEQVRGFWTCVQTAVGDYQRITAGDRPGGAYSPTAVRRFLQKYFFKDGGIDNAKLASLMHVKRLFVGGSEHVITRQELSGVHDLLDFFMQITLDLNAHAPVVFLTIKPADDQAVVAAAHAVGVAINQIGLRLAARNQGLDFSQLQGLGAESYLSLLPQAKTILLSGLPTGIQADEWVPLATALGQAYGILIQGSFAFRSDLHSAINKEYLPNTILDFAQLLDQAVKRHPTTQIPAEEWRALFKKAAPLLSQNAESLSFGFEWFVARLLNGGLAVHALDQRHIAQLASRAASWRDLRSGLTNERFEKMLLTGQVQEWDQHGRLEFANETKSEWSPAARQNMIWPFVFVSWLKDAYGSADAAELNEAQMLSAGKEILITLRKFGWLEQTKDTIGKKLLREADLFTPASNGNGRIDVDEATRYVTMIMSSLRSAQIWLAQVGADSDASSLRARAVSDPEILKTVPRLKRWLAHHAFESYMISAEEIIFDKPLVGRVGLGDLLQVWMIFQYVEGFVARYDSDSSSTISLKESESAFTVFGPVLGKMLAGVGLPPDELFGFFTFMMKYGDTPFTMFGGQVLYNHWIWHRNDWVFESERAELMGILNQLSKL